MWIDLLARGYKKKQKFISLIQVLLIIFILHGILAGAELKWIAIDASAFLGLLTGLQWASVKTEEETVRMWRKISLAILVITLLTMGALQLGLFVGKDDSDRLYVYSLFLTGNFLSMILPCLWLYHKRYPYVWGDHSQKMFLWTGYIILLASGVFTATRSLFLGGILSLFIVTRLSLRITGLLIPLTASLVLSLFLFFATDLDVSLLGERLQNRQGIEEGPRFQELVMLWNQISYQELLWGKGFGIRYHSPVIINGSDLALYPHISIFAFLQKGGTFAFLFLVIVPLGMFLKAILHVNMTADKIAWASGGLLYLFLASMSGGWEFYSLHLYGTFLGGYFGYFRNRATC